jgi:protein required for attachment to host cells
MRTTISAGFRGPRNKRSLVTAVVERQGLLGRQLESEAETTGERRRSEAVTNSRQTDQKEVLGMPERSSAHHMEAIWKRRTRSRLHRAIEAQAREAFMPDRKPYIRLPHRTVVFVGDGRKALFLLNEGTGQEPRLKVQRVFEDENPPTREQGSDRPGRALSGIEPNRSAMEQTNWHDIEKHRFARAIARALDRVLQELHAERVVIVAPPRTLADLRRSFSPTVERLIVTEIAKDLTGLTVRDISQYLTG